MYSWLWVLSVFVVLVVIVVEVGSRSGSNMKPPHVQRGLEPHGAGRCDVQCWQSLHFSYTSQLVVLQIKSKHMVASSCVGAGGAFSHRSHP